MPVPADERTIGDRLAATRRARTLTQEQLAEAASVSVETIRKLERNERTSARVATLNALARALGIHTSALFGNSGRTVARREVDDDDLAMVALRQVIAPARGLHGVDVPTAEPEPPTLREVNEAVWSVDRAYHADDYARALTELPGLLRDARHLADTASASDHLAALRMLAQAQQMAGTVLIQTRKFDLAHRVLDGALDSATAAGDELLGAAGVVSLCWLLLREGRLDEAEQLAVRTADSVEPSFSRATAEHFATWGWLMLRGAAAAVRNNRDDRAGDLLDAASAAAIRAAGTPSVVRSPAPATVGAFGPATVAMKRVETAVIAGNTARALALAAGVPAGTATTSNNLNRYRLDVAFAQLDTGRPGEAAATLRQVGAEAPVWLRHQRYARDIVTVLLDRRRTALTGDLAALAEAVGIPL